jgi:hypothetical protein
MVRWIVPLMFLVMPLMAQPTLNVTQPRDGVVRQNPMKIEVVVEHVASEKVNLDSFEAGGNKLKAHFIQDEASKSKPEHVSSKYVLEFPQMDPGIQPLPFISVNVGEMPVRSIASTIQVREGQPEEVVPFLKLEPLFSGTQPLYPGQRAWVGYKLEFNRSIDLTVEELPFLNAEGFKKLGEKQVRDKQDGTISTRQILQKIEAVAPGKFSISNSQVKGYGYLEDREGNKVYQKPELSDSVGSFVLEVADFPMEGKPASFRGAVGAFSIEASLLSPSTVARGDPVKLKVTVSGEGEFETMQLPDLCCQPGFSGFFKESDLPPLIEANDNKKTFTFSLFPQNSFIHQVPSIEFSFFDPQKKTYGIVKSAPLPLKVTALLPKLATQIAEKPSAQTAEPLIPLPQLTKAEIPLIYWDGWNLIFILPLTGLLVWFLILWRDWNLRLTPQVYYKRALKSKNRDTALRYLEKALKLHYKGTLDGELLLEKVEQERFGLKKEGDLSKLFEDIGKVWDQNS